MKAEKTIRLLKTVPPLQIGFTSPQEPVVQNIAGQSSEGWTINIKSAGTTNESISMTWEDTIDISGISADELSLINQGGAIARCRLPLCSFPEVGSIVYTTYVSVNPVRGSFLERYAYGNSLSSPSESQDWFLATSQTYTRESNGAGFMTKVSENNWGTGGVASSTRLFVKCFVQIDRLALYVPNIGGPQGYAPFDVNPHVINIPPATIGMMAITAEMDAVQTAAAIYRGNDLQQSYDQSN